MPKNETEIDAPVTDVWDVLVDPYAYPEWLVGARRIRAVDPAWPQVGSHFHHVVGGWPFRIKDTTRVREVVAPTRLVLEARARPVGVALVTLTLEACGPDRTRVVFLEEPSAGPVKYLPRPLLKATTRGRNGESLRRLRKLVEARRQASSTP